ncbi:oxygenase MpaB family protein [Actinocorallia sp. API 0066]|uniref:oxygenase MpaB family protein n=1 Tax=Actinocorallia sp. API 0066 TaxID=2896846 RepID=UPI001E59A588|nr:oxygenase MpaB family protein [Actinocorallia sp. API 0066]MCD0453040.1 oxygenase MpaB family protein [Actinocorallia sp. API 0066]
MALHYPGLAERVRRQPELYPDLYGGIDFTTAPYRFTTDPADRSALPEWVAERGPLLADDRVVELIRTTTMLGDIVADPYAALVEKYGVRGLVGMLRQACREGVDAVADAPPELRAFIAAMEDTPSWVDMGLVEEGARYLRASEAYLAPFLMRGAFLATFLNTYAALPMTLTGALSGRRAERRVNETASFFAATTLPGALARNGPGFEAAAMVRLMHSMVRYNALRRSEQWDSTVYGVPVPQVDQMPAGLIGVYLLAMLAQRRGRGFRPRDRAVLELSRYRCFLLGLPEELLPTTAEGVIEVFHGRAALLRDGFDDATCGELVRSTMSARLRPGNSLFDRVAESVERSWGRVFFLAFCGGDRKAAAAMSVRLGPADVVRVGLTAPFILGRFIAVSLASRRPSLRARVDARTTRVLKKRLATYGSPEYTTDGGASRTSRPTG